MFKPVKYTSMAKIIFSGQKWSIQILVLLAIILLPCKQLFAQSSAGITTVVCTKLTGNGSGDSALHTSNVAVSPIYTLDAAEVSKTIQNIVKLSVKEENQNLLNDFDAKIDLKIEYGSNASNLNEKLQSLSVSYSKASGIKYGAKNYVALANFQYVKVTVTGISTTSSIDTSTLENLLLLENEMRITRYYALGSNITPSFSGTSSTSDGLRVSWVWPSGTGNNATQLEWTWLEDELSANYTVNGIVNTNSLFNNNATRVDLSTSRSAYEIPLFYDGVGKIYYRIRAINYLPNGTATYGPWFVGSPFSFNGHDNNLNWQVTTSYAEEGKRKTVMKYFDGSLRGRQTVTKDNTTNTTVVAETFYNASGRAAVQVLPAPTISTVVAYTKNLNLFNGQVPGTNPAAMFDLEPLTLTGSAKHNETPPLDSTSGASQYYSANNPSTDNITKQLPKASGYPYTVTHYTPDATGRVMYQSGVGSAMKIGSGHETKYYYGAASQEELNGLFGTEVGNASHYFKNMVSDANGQMSVSYTDMHGRTIATALAGQSPAVQTSLDISNASHYPNQSGAVLKRNLLNNATNVVKGNNIESVNSLLLPVSTSCDFSYSLSPQNIQMAQCGTTQTVCFDCLYDLEISITDESGDHAPIVRRFNNISMDSTGSCQSPTFTSSSLLQNNSNSSNGKITFTEVIGPGSFSIRKTLTMSAASMQRQDSLYNLKGLCTTLQQHLIDSVTGVLQSVSGCKVSKPATELTCQSCKDSLGDYAQFRAKYVAGMGTDTLSESQMRAIYVYDSTSCNKLCGTSAHTLESIRQSMLQNMIPFAGQYANDPADTSAAYHRGTMFTKYNIFSVGSSTPPFYQHPWQNSTSPIPSQGKVGVYFTAMGDSDVTSIPLSGLSDTAFTSTFNSTWANQLLPYHPEYSRLRFAEDTLREAYTWIDSFALINSYSYAKNHNYIGSDGSIVGDKFYPLAPSSYKATIDGFVKSNYIGDLSMWQVAYGDAYCKQIPDSIARGNCYHNAPKTAASFPSNMPTDKADQIWSVFIGHYMSARNSQVSDFIGAHCPLGDDTALLNQGYQLSFPKSNAQVAQQNKWTWLPDAPTTNAPDISSVKVQADSFHAGECLSYVPSWKQQLLKCDSLASKDSATQSTILNAITSRMVAVCNKSITTANPHGSSTLPFGSATTANGDTSFEQIVNAVYAQYHINANLYCNPYSIVSPKPYGTNPQYTQNYISQVDTCTCNQWMTVKVAVKAADYDSSSFADINQFLKDNNYGDTITRPLFDSLQYDCSNMIIPMMFNKVFAATTSMNRTSSVNGNYIYDTLSNKLKVIFETGLYDSIGTTDCYLKFDSISTIPHNASIVSATMKLFASPSDYKISYLCSECRGPQMYFNALDYQWSTTNHSAIEASNNLIESYDWRFDMADTSQDIVYNAKNQVEQWRESSINTGLRININEQFSESRVDFAAFYSNRYSDPSKRPSLSVTYMVDSTVTYTLSSPQPMPRFLQCGYTPCNNCLTCGKMVELKQEFQTIFGSPYDSAPLFGVNIDSAKNAYNGLFARFINFRTGLQNNWIDYADAATVSGCVLNAGGSGISQGCPSGSAVDSLTLNTTDTSAAATYVARESIILAPGYFSNSNSDIFINSQLTVCTSPISGSGLALSTTSASQTVICRSVKPLTDTTGMNLVVLDACDGPNTQALVIAQSLYTTRQQQLLGNFQNTYKSKCLSAQDAENFSVTYHNTEYHYTLYYYDLAGNLVKTVPPKGVNPNFDTVFTKSVEANKAAGTQLVPGHTFATNYRYNSLKQVVAKHTPDDSTSHIWYDRLGRLTISQNAKQANPPTGGVRAYSYTLYDALGRVTEVGQKPNTIPMTQAIAQDSAALFNWLNDGNANREQITYTIYDDAYTPVNSLYLSQQNLRNRVSYTATKKLETDASFCTATYYSYDAHGNVDTLLQDFKGIAAMNSTANRFKKLVYNFDLISGKVNQVSYQPGKADAFYHRYEYDAENRLTEVFTSRDSIVWERDAAYTYYKHGPLAQTVLGQQQVQGMNYLYTLQGWLKGVNTANTNTMIARGAYNYALNYYNGDYTNLNGTSPSDGIASQLGTYNRQLFNGNIGSMALSIPKLGNAYLYNYQYDQLNRLVGMDAWKGADSTWNTLTKGEDYKERLAYDPNGNITSYLRNGTTSNGNSLRMDSLQYNYYSNSNKLNSINDSVPANNYANDIDNQSSNNYSYDLIGNLTSDVQGGIANIKWTVYGKIDSITKSNGTIIKYMYDASGNRISKKVNDTTECYVRDASGNVMSIYKQAGGNNSVIQSEIDIFGSSRLGTVGVQTVPPDTITLANGSKMIIGSITRGEKNFELSNHLGNVLVTVNDKKFAVDSNGDGVIDYYLPDIASAQDYYPFGMSMPRRTFMASNSTNYCYGFNGQEKTNEVYGEGNSYTAEFWQYDARIGRRWNVDPVVKPNESPYATFANSPIWLSDPNGKDTTLPAADGRNLTLPTGATFETFQAGTKYTHASNGKEVSVAAGSVSAFTVDGNRYTARFDPETLAFTSYQDASGKSIVQENTSSLTGGYLNPLSLTGAMYGWDSYARLNSYISPMMDAKNLYNAGQLSANSASLRRFFFLQDTRSKLSPLGDFISESKLFNGKSIDKAREQVTKALYSNLDDATKAGKVFNLRPSTTNWARFGKVGGPLITVATQGYVYYTIIRDNPPLEKLKDDMDTPFNPGYWIYRRTFGKWLEGIAQ